MWDEFMVRRGGWLSHSHGRCDEGMDGVIIFKVQESSVLCGRRLSSPADVPRLSAPASPAGSFRPHIERAEWTLAQPDNVGQRFVSRMSALGVKAVEELVSLRCSSTLPKRICNRDGKCDGDVYRRQNQAKHHDGKKIHPPRVSMHVLVIVERYRSRSDHDVACQTEKNQGNEAEAEKPPARWKALLECFA